MQRKQILKVSILDLDKWSLKLLQNSQSIEMKICFNKEKRQPIRFKSSKPIISNLEIIKGLLTQ